MLERAVILQPAYSKKGSAYNWEFDRSAKANLEWSRPSLASQEYQRRKDQLDSLIAENLRSEIRERFFSLQYQTIYTFENGKIASPYHDGSFDEIIKNGINWRREHGSPDTIREEAELVGFRRVEQILSQGQSALSISPRGGSYLHNYFDFYDPITPSQIEMTRFIATPSYEGFWQAAHRIDPSIPTPLRLTDDFFLSHPAQTNLTLSEILKIIEPDANAMPKEKIEAIVANCSEFIEAYVTNPSEKNYKAVINFADVIGGKGPKNIILHPHLKANIDAAIAFYAALPEREVATPCPAIFGSNKEGKHDKWSVGEFGLFRDGAGTLEINCQTCGASYIRTSAILEPRCRWCSGTAGIACAPSPI